MVIRAPEDGPGVIFQVFKLVARYLRPGRVVPHYGDYRQIVPHEAVEFLEAVARRAVAVEYPDAGVGLGQLRADGEAGSDAERSEDARVEP